MPRFNGGYGGFQSGIDTSCDSYFDTKCDDEDESDEDDDEDTGPNYDRYEDEPSEEEEEYKYKSRRRVKTRATCKLLGTHYSFEGNSDNTNFFLIENMRKTQMS